MIAFVKFLHIAALAIWCAGLIGLPLLLAKHDSREEQQDYSRLRILTHQAYISVVTPAAVIAIALGTALIFMRGVFEPWMFAKLVLVGMLVLAHAWIGHVTLKVGEEHGFYDPPAAWPLVAISMTVMLTVLALVLGKPLLGEDLAPDWLKEPQGHPLPVDEVPS